MNINPLGFHLNRPQAPVRAAEAKESFFNDQQIDGFRVGSILGVAGAVLLGVPAAVGAAGGALGVGAVAAGSAALAYIAPDNSDDRSGNTSTALTSATIGGCLAGIGAAAGTMGAMACAGVGAAVGLALIGASLVWVG